MEKQLLQYYKMIGKLNIACSNAESFQDALRTGISLISGELVADYAAIWYVNRKDNRLHPYYWTYPADITHLSYAPGEGNVGNAFASGEIATEGNKAWIPFSDTFKGFGCLEIAKKDGDFTEEDLDAARILTMFAEMALAEKAALPAEWQNRECLVCVKDIEKEFQNGDVVTKVLKGISFDIYKGELLVFLGESGCGKTTLLNIIGGMDETTSGSVTFDGEDITKMNRDELTRYRRDNIGFIFQSYNLMPNLNAKQNLDLMAKLVANPMDSLEALQMVGMGEKTGSYPAQMSGGQQQRISIARAIVKKPKMILADEPTAALDYATSIEVLHTLETIKNAGTTIVMVTHNEEIARMADRILRFRNGLISEITVNMNPAHAEDLLW